ncbi:glycosyltransferase family 4 protein [Salinarimonas ramus]|uniref:Glycosyl transferase n=1 Tax=Salinarimonas ramus TaxID=690164 RepID=A0A917V503_9HYPH|nr:glycosyltransferase family 4 protein [Salinarimonas ramus]GGK38282.1 glycosyl transferase [Salinarimonas ramus]
MSRPRETILIWSPVERSAAGGVQRVVRRLVDHLGTGDAKVVTAWAEGARVEGESGVVLPLWVRPSAKRPLHLPSLAAAARLLARVRPDVVNVHFPTAGAWYFVLLKPLFRFRLVLSFHGSDLLRPLSHDEAFLPRLVAGADTITVVSDHLRGRLGELAHGAREVVSVPNGIDLGFWSPDAQISERDGPLLAVGRLEPVKGFDVLLDAVARVRAANPDARLDILGDGSQRGALEARAEALGIADAVAFAGDTDHATIRERLRRTRGFVLSSRSEGMPLSLLEAMACGAPSIATRVGGVEQVLAGHGLVVEPEDPADLAEGMETLLADPAAARARAARALAHAATFDERAANARYETVLLREASDTP